MVSHFPFLLPFFSFWEANWFLEMSLRSLSYWQLRNMSHGYFLSSFMPYSHRYSSSRCVKVSSGALLFPFLFICSFIFGWDTTIPLLFYFSTFASFTKLAEYFSILALVSSSSLAISSLPFIRLALK